MAAIGANFNGSVFSRNFPIVIATNRASAVLLPIRLAYDSDGYPVGQVLARNTTSGYYSKYDSGGSSGTDTAAAILFEQHPAEDFSPESATGSTMAVGIFGGCTVYKDRLTDWDSDAKTDLKAVEIIDATGVTTIKF